MRALMGATPHPAGEMVLQYRILEKLGQGGMGVVYLAEDTRLGRRVAIKMLRPEETGDAHRRQRLEQEARAAANLSHPAIATVFALEESTAGTFIVFEYVPGETLRSLVEPGGLDSDMLLAIALDVASALDVAHSAGIVHRDLKPENVMRAPEGGCKVLDFGLARIDAALEDSLTQSRLTTAGTVLGTIGYMSPEQLEARPVDFRTDIFSFGAMLYELATGIHPFESGSKASTIAAVLKSDPPSLSARNPIHPPELDRIVRKCLRKQREDRYQSTRDLLVDLRNLKRESSEAGITPLEAGDDEDNLYRAALKRFLPTPRRWWDLHQLFALFVYLPIYFYSGVRLPIAISSALNTSVASNWHGSDAVVSALKSGAPADLWRSMGLPFFVVLIVLLSQCVAARLYLICLALFIPGRLRTDVARVQYAINGMYMVLAVQFIAAGWLLLRVTDRELILGGWSIGLGVLFMVAVFVETIMVWSAFPQAFARRSRESNKADADKSASRDSILLANVRRLIPDPRRMWEFWLLLSIVSQPAVVVLAWLVRKVSIQSWTNPWFTAILMMAAAQLFLRSSVLLRAAVLPRELPERIAQFRYPMRIVSLLEGLLALLATPQLSINRYPTAAPLAVLSGISILTFGLLIEPMNERMVFPELAQQRRSSAEEQAHRRGRFWWWLTQLGTLFGTAPLVVWLHWQARLRLPLGLRDVVFWLNVTAVALHWCTRFSVVHGAFGGAAEVAKQAARIGPWIRRTGWPVVAGIAADAVLVGYWSGDPVLTAILGALAMAGVAALAFIEPGAERAAFSEIGVADPIPPAASMWRQLEDPRLFRIAAGHVAYILLLIAPVAIGRISLDEVFQGISAQTTAQLGLVVYSLVMTVGGTALLANLVEILKEGLPGVRTYRRWFPGFLFVDLVATGAWIVIAFTGHEGRHTPAFVALTVAVTLLVLPFAQRHMADQLLQESEKGLLPSSQT